MPTEIQIRHAQIAVQNLGPERALICLEESDEGVALTIFDTQDADERLIALDGLPFVSNTWPDAEQLLALILGFRRTREPIKSSIRVERVVAEQRRASADC